ncbi:MAG: DUF1150 family protein [Pseudodonghicola sp.]
MNTPFDFNQDGRRIVYVKEVNVADLPAEVQAGAGGRDHLYAVHDAEGQQLALVADRRLAFILARQNDFEPVTVH